LAALEVMAAETNKLCIEDLFIAEHYHLENVVSCAKEHEDYLNELMQSPNKYFQPEIVALCDPPKDISKLSANNFGGYHENLDNLVFGGEVLELAPSSPPRLRRRAHVPLCNRGAL